MKSLCALCLFSAISAVKVLKLILGSPRLRGENSFGCGSNGNSKNHARLLTCVILEARSLRRRTYALLPADQTALMHIILVTNVLLSGLRHKSTRIVSPAAMIQLLNKAK